MLDKWGRKMKLLKFTLPVIAISLSGCLFTKTEFVKPKNHKFEPVKVENKKIETVGYSTTESYKRFPQAQQKLLAIRGAKLNAYRNLAEEVYGIKIKGKSTVKDMIVKNDTYRVYIDTMIRGAHIEAISETKSGFFEAEVSLTLTPRYTYCLYNPSLNCLNSANQYQPEIINNDPNRDVKSPVGIYDAPHGHSSHRSYPAAIHHTAPVYDHHSAIIHH